MSQSVSCDVLIVGGGPAGLSVAAGLPDYVSSVVVHQDAEIGKPVRTSGGSFLKDVQALGIPDHLYRVMKRVEVFSDNEIARFETRVNPPVILDVTGTYRYLAGLSDHKNRQLFLETKLTGLRRVADGRYLADVRSRTGKVESISARYVVEASGVQFAALRALGLAVRPARTGVGIEYEYPIGTTDPDRAVLFVGASVPAGYGWAFPTADDRLRLGVGVIRPDTDASPRDLMAALLAGPLPARMGLDLSGDVHVNAGTVPSEPYDPSLVHGRVIRVGDTANFATPTAGEGIRICIRHGLHLGEALGRALHLGRDTPLAAYEAACNRDLARNYRWGFAANRRIARYGPAEWDASARRLARLNEAEFTALLRSEFGAGMVARAIWKSLRHKVMDLAGRDTGAG